MLKYHLCLGKLCKGREKEKKQKYINKNNDLYKMNDSTNLLSSEQQM
jgi:hypothetical protein